MARTPKPAPKKSVRTPKQKRAIDSKDEHSVSKKQIIAKKEVPAFNTQQPEADRKRKLPKYKTFALAKRIPHPDGPIAGPLTIAKNARRLLFRNWKPLLGLVLVYAIFHFAFVRGFRSPLDITAIKESLTQALGAQANRATLTSAVVGSLFNNAGLTGSDSGGVYQVIMVLIFSIAIIWIFRQSAAGNKPTLRGALYTGMYPLIPFILVLAIMGLQLVPTFLSTFIFSSVIDGGIAASGLEKALWFLLFAGLIILSIYMLCSSLFALFVVTLPGMTPLKALRSARTLVFSRRWAVLFRLVMLLVFLLLLLVVVVVPCIYFLPYFAPWVYFGLMLVGMLFIHGYMFSLYKELL